MSASAHTRAVALAELGLVALGGGLGALTRYLLTLAIGDPVVVAGLAFPVAVFVINLSGAFALGLLIESLGRLGDDSGARRRVRLLLGTGMLGGHTTYSALAEGTASLLLEGTAAAILMAAGYALGTVILGGVMSLLGILVARGIPQRSAPAAPEGSKP